MRSPWVQCSCPLSPWTHGGKADASPSFAIRVEANGESYFTCFVCHSGKLGDLIVELQHWKAENLGYDLGAAWRLVEFEEARKLHLTIKDWGAGEICVPDWVIPDTWLAEFQAAWAVPASREYLQSRDVSEAICQRLCLLWDRSRATVCFPIRNAHAELVSLRGRYVNPKPGAPPYHVYGVGGPSSGQAWLGEHWVDYDAPVLMVESVFDLASCLRVYGNVLAPLSVGINQARMQRVAKASQVVTLFDQGVGGDKARTIVERSLKTASVIHRIPTAKDPGEMSESALRSCLAGVLRLQPPLT